MIGKWSIAAAALAACLGAAAAGAGQAEPEPIYNVAADDPEMEAAKARAIAGLPQFYQRLARPAADETRFMVKFDILPGDEAEFVWAGDLDRSTVPMTGVLVNQPVYTDHRLGQRVAIAEADVIDWSYSRGRIVQGAFTQRVLIDRMPAAEAAALRDAMGW